MLLPDHHRNSPPQTMTKSPSRTFIRDRLLLGITPITHDFYNQWARSPKPPDVNTSDTGNSDSGVNETRVKTSAPRPAARMPGSRTDLKSANPRVGSCRSNTPSLNIELPPMPVLRRAVTVVGNERMGSVCSERGSSVLLPKKVLPSSQILPMNQAVFLFKGDSFIQNAPFLGDPNRGRSGSRLSTYYSSPNQRLPSNKTPSRVTLKGELRGSNTGPVQVAKVQFIDFSDEKSYIASRREDTKDKDTPKDKQFLPLSIPLGVSVS